MPRRRTPEERAEAVRLRSAGYSIPEIADALDAARSTIWRWVGDVPLARPRHSRGPGSPGSLVLRRRDSERLRIKNDSARETMRIRDDASFLALGAMAYWCEGYKDKIYDRRERVRFSNSDPTMIRFFLDWLLAVGVEPDRFVFQIYLHETADVASAEAFWAAVAQISPSELRPTVFKRHQPRTNRLNTGDHYHGVMAVSVQQSRVLYQQIEGWMRGSADAMARCVESRLKNMPDSLAATGSVGRSAVG